MRKQAYRARSGQQRYRPIITERDLYGDECKGFCLGCGKGASGVEPDARRYVCDHCGAEKVYGLEELVLMGLAIVKERS
jgi:hypothetical protein